MPRTIFYVTQLGVSFVHGVGHAPTNKLKAGLSIFFFFFREI